MSENKVQSLSLDLGVKQKLAIDLSLLPLDGNPRAFLLCDPIIERTGKI